MSTQEQEIFHEMLAALQDVVNWYGAPTQGDAPAIARAKQALAKAEAFDRRDGRTCVFQKGPLGGDSRAPQIIAV